MRFQKLYLFLFVVVTATSFGYTFISSRAALSGNNAASASYAGNPMSVTDLLGDYGTVLLPGKVRVLIVPGHEPDYGGAEYGTVLERDLVAELGQDLESFLNSEGNYTVFATRDSASWNSIFSNYFAQNWDSISAWLNTSRFASSLEVLGTSTAPLVNHVSVPDDVALRLYGITKWANENKIDVVLHLHLNDYPGRQSTTPGIYSGLAMYTPAQRFENSTTTRALADSVFRRLSLYNPISNLPVESSGIIDDPELIAVGANNTALEASMLIEYGYIYEHQFSDPKVRSLALRDLAYQTYLGLQDFFTKNTAVSVTSRYFPQLLYDWKTPVVGKKSNPEDIYAMQTALLLDNSYPPPGKSMNDCPHSGIYGPCTSAAVAAFQKKYAIKEAGPSGTATFYLLHSMYIKQ